MNEENQKPENDQPAVDEEQQTVDNDVPQEAPEGPPPIPDVPKVAPLSEETPKQRKQRLKEEKRQEQLRLKAEKQATKKAKKLAAQQRRMERKLKRRTARLEKIKNDPKKHQPTPIIWGFSSMIALGFGAGLMPGAPGTWGSLLALFFAGYLMYFTTPLIFGIVILVTFLIGWGVTSYYCEAMDEDDPSEVVIDEFVGQWITLIVIPYHPWFILLGFVLFRFFDILKPPPIRWIERIIPGGLGVMVDDVVAGIYAAILMFAIYHGPKLAGMVVPW